jgi:hypothetical protein
MNHQRAEATVTNVDTRSRKRDFVKIDSNTNISIEEKIENEPKNLIICDLSNFTQSNQCQFNEIASFIRLVFLRISTNAIRQIKSN